MHARCCACKQDAVYNSLYACFCSATTDCSVIRRAQRTKRQNLCHTQTQQCMPDNVCFVTPIVNVSTSITVMMMTIIIIMTTDYCCYYYYCYSQGLTNVCTGSQTQSSHQAGTQVTDDVAIQVWHDKNIKLRGILHQLHACIVHNDLLVLDVWVPLLHCRHAKQ